MKRLIRKILREHKSDKYYKFMDRVSTMIRMPYFKSMENFTIYDRNDQEYIMRKILGDITIIKGGLIYDDNGNEIYFENTDGRWQKYEYDENGNMLYSENSYGYWMKYEYNDNGIEIYFENSNGYIRDYR